MQEFSSISVSSYEAGVLADRLTEQSREGWEVVAIVPTGSTVTAYLSRAADGGSAAPAVEVEPVDHEVADEAPGQPAEPQPEVQVETEADADAGAAADAETLIEEVTPDAADDAGWASLAAEVAESADDPIVPTLPDSAPGVVVEPEPAPAAIEPEPAANAVEPEPAANAVEPAAATQPEPAAEPAAEGAAASAAAPAGWYADPSSRFELRYWDGAQWTEHVSRSGQQYTDPPVA